MPGQTLSEIRALLATQGLAPRHRYGQNFLVDLNLMRKLVEKAELRPADVILEVGPGTGSLTELLLDAGPRVLAVEIDTGLQSLLRARFADSVRFTLVAADTLASKHRINPELISRLQALEPDNGGARKLVANLPYQIATPLLLDLLALDTPMERMVCTIQREVGERILAAPRSPDYGPVSVIMQTFASVRVVAHLPPTVFWPAPKVDSVMLDIRPLRGSGASGAEAADFSRFVNAGFQQRRKMLRRIWMDVEPAALEKTLTDCDATPTQRPEELSPEQWRRLHRAFSHLRPPA
ncbi:MAG: ribosomal RNA small subunit methyltransferase A [Planctomycetes bacterium]|nr:ribosomal RNA small subunit methyltransferase A [Planctomycetota bacterium]